MRNSGSEEDLGDVLGFEARELFDVMTDSIIVMDHTGTIRYANRAVRKMFGYEANQLVGEPVEKLMPSSLHKLHDDYLRTYLDTGVARIMGMGRELIACKSDGENFPIHLVTTEAQRDDEQIFIGVMRDLSEVSETNRARSEQREQLAHAGRLITMGELTASFAHEVNQPLAAISMYAQACQRLMQKDDFDRDLGMQTLQKLTDQTLRAGEIVETIQHFVQTGNAVRAWANLNAVLAEIQHLIAGDALLNDIEVVFELTPSALDVWCDAGQIQQVAVNLLRNGVEAMAEIGCRHGSQLKLSTEMGEGCARVIVDDAGNGVTEEQMPQMFAAFSSTKMHGIGLGLSICKSIVEDHHGYIDFENKLNEQGCRFYFELPTRKTNEQQ